MIKQYLLSALVMLVSWAFSMWTASVVLTLIGYENEAVNAFLWVYGSALLFLGCTLAYHKWINRLAKEK
jgi:hypothetical protein